MKKIYQMIFMMLAILVVVSGCGNQNSKNDKLKIYATNYPYESFAKQIGGEHVEVDSIYPSGTDLHNYEPTQKEMINVAKSDLFIFSSKELDPVAKKISSTIKNKDYKLEAIPNLKGNDILEHHHEHGEEHNHKEEPENKQDPHIWLDPIANKEAAKSIKNKPVSYTHLRAHETDS